MAFRKNRAQVRYWLWFSASLKFLIPFSLLLNLGAHIGRSAVTKATAAPAIAVTVVEFAEPFTDIAPPSPSHSLPSPQSHAPRAAGAALGFWACGFLAVLLVRLRGWLGIRSAGRLSTPMDVRCPLEVRSSPARLEPGVIGFLRPMLLLPAEIAEYLTPSQLESVLAHEMCHVRRRDNLTAAIHMCVEALFWFFPLVWWIGAPRGRTRARL